MAISATIGVSSGPALNSPVSIAQGGTGASTLAGAQANLGITGGGGSGTVTSVSVTTANGISGTVATATTTPAITLVLGAITPSSINTSGTITFAGGGTITSSGGGTSNLTLPVGGPSSFNFNGVSTIGYAASSGQYASDANGGDTIFTAASGRLLLSANGGGTSAVQISSSSVGFNTPIAITSSSANALAVGISGATNPALNVDASTASSVTGLNIKSAASGGGIALTTTSSSANEAFSVSSKGTGALNLTGSSVGGSGVNIIAGGSNINVNNGSILTVVNGVSMFSYDNSHYIFAMGVSSTASTIRFGYTGASDTALTASTEAPSVYFNINQTRSHATGALSLQRDFRISGTTHSFVGASTLTNLAALSIDLFGQAGTNATVTNAHGILIPTQAVSGTVVNAYGISIFAPTGASTLNQAALFTGDVGVTTGNIIINTAGKGIQIKSGSNARIGTGTLSGGTLAVANTSVTANTRVFLTDTTSGALTNVGSLTVVTSAGVGFTVSSTNVLDTSTFNWILIESA